MGTHPIFESDFDCLTDLRSFTLGQVAARDAHDAPGRSYS